MKTCRLMSMLFLLVGVRAGASVPAVVSPLPATTLTKLQQALPKVAYPVLQQILQSPQTLWYDNTSIKPSYQAAIQESPPYGANSNDKWFDLIADSVQATAKLFYDPDKKNYLFPFATTAGAEDCTNLTTFNFLWLPAKGNALLPVAAGPKPHAIADQGLTMDSWGWIYPVGAVVGEVLFVTTSAGDWLPSEIRTRTRTPTSWANDVFRPFPTALSLSQAIQAARPNWATVPALNALVEHLEDNTNLTASSLHATTLPGVFDQDGALDILPDFDDDALVTELLTQTPFYSTYEVAWKSGNGLTTYAASTQSDVSIVPKGYAAGLLEVNDESCMRCHEVTARPLASFGPNFGDIVLYGEMWGRDGIFSFHPFDESKYDIFWNTEYQDNRKMNSNFASQGILATFNSEVHVPPDYPANEIVGYTSSESAKSLR